MLLLLLYLLLFIIIVVVTMFLVFHLHMNVSWSPLCCIELIVKLTTTPFNVIFYHFCLSFGEGRG